MSENKERSRMEQLREAREILLSSLLSVTENSLSNIRRIDRAIEKLENKEADPAPSYEDDLKFLKRLGIKEVENE
jgi:hypothetical protein